MSTFQDSINPLLAGAIAGQASLLCVHPMDVIRTRLQTNPQYTGVIQCATQTLKNEGASAFYKGLIAPLAAQGVYKAVMFGSVHHISNYIRQKNVQSGSPQQLSPGQLFLCGSLAGIINSFVVTPVELIRNRLIVNNNSLSNAQPVTIRSILRDVTAKNGIIPGLWTGQLSTSIRDGLGVGSFFFCNYKVTQFLKANSTLSDGTIQLIGGMAAGVGFWTVSLPLDRVKSIIQTQSAEKNSNPFQILSYIFKNEGIKGLYRGLPVGLGRGIPGGAITFYVNHKMMNYLTSKKQVKV
jgi:solute carrier family 25 carnitine/acylcarnitine transporter 20/29